MAAILSVSIHSRPIKPGELISHKRMFFYAGFNPLPTNKAGRNFVITDDLKRGECFNPLPTNKAGRKRLYAACLRHFSVSIHSRPIKPGEGFIAMIKEFILGVSIHSRPIKPGEVRTNNRGRGLFGFNPLPTNKAGRIDILIYSALDAQFQSTPDQ